MGHVITVMCKLPAYSVTAELTHMAKKTMDPAKWREEALKFFSATHYQKAREFSDVLTANFAPGSTGAAKLRKAEEMAPGNAQVLRSLLIRYGGKATNIALRNAMMQIGVTGNTWSSWWRNARKQASTSPWFRVSGTAQKTVTPAIAEWIRERS